MGWKGSMGEAKSYPRGSRGGGLCLPTSIPLKGFLEEAVNLVEFSLLFQSIQEGFLEETQVNW